MYLKQLVIQGFKSFPDKTVVGFGHDITAIVGPNGSGKSNISDAIRWVMGEQNSRSLRGQKMEDVIFGGTEKRAPVGFAEATLVLDNSDRALHYDADELMVTRRYYRSGESEYYINKQSVRLRDVNELFMDTGLGRDGYSNISQGRIDEILSLKSTDRREIFEEAAGISKYRHRKEETERRHDAGQSDPHRRQDLGAGAAGRSAARSGGKGKALPDLPRGAQGPRGRAVAAVARAPERHGAQGRGGLSFRRLHPAAGARRAGQALCHLGIPDVRPPQPRPADGSDP